MKTAKDYKNERDFYRQALKDAVAIIVDIVNEECCTYGYTEDINRLEMISENKKPCQFCSQILRSDSMECLKREVFCVPGSFPECEKETSLFPPDDAVEKTEKER